MEKQLPLVQPRDLETVKADLHDTAAGKFGDDPEILKEITTERLVLYHAVRRVLRPPDLVEVLAEVHATADADRRQELLLATFHQRPELHVLFGLAEDLEEGKEEAALGRQILLSGEQPGRFRGLLAACRQARRRITGVEGLVDPDSVGAAMLEEMDHEAVVEFVDRVYAAGEWLHPETALLAIERVQAAAAPQLLQPQTWIEWFLDEDHYRTAIQKFEAVNQPYLADTARLFLLYGTLLRRVLQSQSTQSFPLEEAKALLDRTDGYPPQSVEVFGELQELVVIVRASLRVTVGADSRIPVVDRTECLEKAEADFASCRGFAPMRWLAPSIRWMRAQLLQGYQREELEVAACDWVNELIAELASEKESIPRLTGMATLLLQPASWKFQRGEYRGTIESATMAKSMAGAAVAQMRKDLQEFLRQMDKEMAELDANDEEAAQFAGFRATITSMAQGTELLGGACEVLILTSRAKLADRRGEYVEASKWYQKAAECEKAMFEKARQIFAALFKGGGLATTLTAGLPNQARSAYFSAMAELHRGDQCFTEGDFSEARKHYTDARQLIDGARQLWEQEAARLGDTPVANRAKVDQEQKALAVRARYCDAKMEISDAEAYSSIGQFWEAAKGYEKATRIFSELLTSLTLDAKEEGDTGNRNARLLKACEEFCRSRYLMERDRDRRADDSFAEVLDLLSSAEARFEACDEPTWVKFVSALRDEHLAYVERERARSLPQPAAQEWLVSSRYVARNAARRFDSLGWTDRARRLQDLPQQADAPTRGDLPRLPFPKPSDPPPEFGGTAEQTLSGLTAMAGGRDRPAHTDPRLVEFQARAIALEKGLADLKQAYTRSRITDERYTELRVNLDTERIGILMHIQRTLGGRDKELDALLQDAIQGKQDEELRPTVLDIASKRGLDSSQIERLKRGDGSVLGCLAGLSSGVVHQQIVFQAGSQTHFGGTQMNIEKDTVKITNSTLTNSPVAVRQSLSGCYNRIEQLPAGEVQGRLKTLHAQVAELMTKLEPAQAEEAKQNLETLVGEVAKPQPRKKWFDLSAEGLTEAAKTVGELSAPILTTLSAIGKALFP